MIDKNSISVERYWQSGLRALRAGLFYSFLYTLVFYEVGATPLAALSVADAALFYLCIKLVHRQRYGAVMILVRVAILITVIADNWAMGWDAGFHYYALVLPVLASVTFSAAI